MMVTVASRSELRAPAPTSALDANRGAVSISMEKERRGVRVQLWDKRLSPRLRPPTKPSPNRGGASRHAVTSSTKPAMSAGGPKQQQQATSSTSYAAGTISIELVEPRVPVAASASVVAIVDQIRDGLLADAAPVLVGNCTGGVYMLRTTAGHLAAVFKPADEEPYAANHPKRFRQKPNKKLIGLRTGIPVGGAAFRELAAFIVDHDGHAGVPTTALAMASHPAFCYRASKDNASPKLGALQVYVPHQYSADVVGATRFGTDNVHAIAVLDVRLANQDRHGGNLLVQTLGRRNACRLVPIDHGACLPLATELSETSFAWLWWPQARQPFAPATLAYIASLDAESDVRRLEAAGIKLEPDALLTLRLCTELLKVCAVEWRMTAYEIGGLMCRQGTFRQQELSPSVLEQLVTKSLCLEVDLQPEATASEHAYTVKIFRQHLTTYLLTTRSISQGNKSPQP